VTATLRFDIVSDGSGARRELAATRGELDRFDRAANTVGTTSERSSGKLGRFGSAIGNAARTFGPLAAAAAAGAVLKIGVDSIKAASDTQQAFGAIDSIFGRNSERVKEWANNAAQQVGLARGEYATLATTLGASLKNSGLEGYTQKTRDLITTAGDLAATFGGTTSEAVSALSSLLRGETDPIERYGVSIKASDVAARLAAQGQDKLTGASKTQAEMQARLKLLTEQTTDSTGAFKRESNTLAGQQQRLSAEFQNAKDKLGQALIPALTKGLGAVNDLFAGGGKLSGAMDKLAGIVGPFLTPIINGAKNAFNNIKDAISGSENQSENLRKAFGLVRDIAEKLAPIVGTVLGKALEGLGKIIGDTITFADNLAGAIAGIVTWAQKAWDKITSLGNNPAIKKLVGLFNSGDERLVGLQRGAGGLVRDGLARPWAGGYVAPPIHLTSSPSVVVEVDSPAMARMFRVIVRDELAHAGLGGGRKP
jgi:hypothetical protein